MIIWKIIVYLKKAVSILVFAALIVMPVTAFAIDWQDCRISTRGSAHTVKASCAQLSVPENRDDKNSRTIQLRIATIWAWNKNTKPDPVLYLAGGPGQSAIESYLQLESGFQQLLKDRNILLIDQRGTGQSNPLTCSVSKEYLFTTPSEEQSKTFLSNCLKSLDADTRFYTTTESIKDLEAVRKALSIEQWNLIGVSYGTRKALTYAKMFPTAIRSMVLDGVVPQQEALGEHHEQNILAALKLQFDECKRQSDCDNAFGDVQATMTALLEQADKNPMSLNLPDPITGTPTKFILTREVLTAVIRMFSYSADNYRLIPLLLNLAKNGQPENLAAQAMLISSSIDNSIALGMDMSVVCTEDTPYYSTTKEGTHFFTQQSMTTIRRRQCESWPHIKAEESFKQPVQTDIPTLLLSGEFDPVTPPHFAEVAAATLPHSQQLVAKGVGHGVFVHGCMPYVVRDFIDEPSKQVNADCIKDFSAPPFFINLMGPVQ